MFEGEEGERGDFGDASPKHNMRENKSNKRRAAFSQLSQGVRPKPPSITASVSEHEKGNRQPRQNKKMRQNTEERHIGKGQM